MRGVEVFAKREYGSGLQDPHAPCGEELRRLPMTLETLGGLILVFLAFELVDIIH